MFVDREGALGDLADFRSGGQLGYVSNISDPGSARICPDWLLIQNLPEFAGFRVENHDGADTAFARIDDGHLILMLVAGIGARHSRDQR
jgi:hypothetical protein